MIPPRKSRADEPHLVFDMNLPPEIFKAYDVRGVVGKTLTPPIVRAIGQALGTLAREKGRDALVVGRDGRLSGPELAAAVAEGIRAAGADVIDIGMVTTPMSYFAASHLETQSSVMVTTSRQRITIASPGMCGLRARSRSRWTAATALPARSRRRSTGGWAAK